LFEFLVNFYFAVDIGKEWWENTKYKEIYAFLQQE